MENKKQILNIVTFRKQAENIEITVVKGNLAGVDGRIKQELS